MLSRQCVTSVHQTWWWIAPARETLGERSELTPSGKIVIGCGDKIGGGEILWYSLFLDVDRM